MNLRPLILADRLGVVDAMLTEPLDRDGVCVAVNRSRNQLN